jgi:hypothetical protein
MGSGNKPTAHKLSIKIKASTIATAANQYPNPVCSRHTVRLEVHHHSALRAAQIQSHSVSLAEIYRDNGLRFK